MGFKVLGLDASGPALAVGYLDDSRVVADFYWTRPRTAGSHLVPWVGALVEQFGRPDGLAVGVGPGSFTGVRIAVTAAKAYAYAWDLPVVGVSSLAAWALAAPVGTTVLVTSERRGPAFYAGHYAVEPDGPRALRPDWAVDAEASDPLVATGRVAVVGPLADDGAWLERQGPGAYRLDLPLLGSSVARLGRIRLQWGQTDSRIGLAPVYIRPPATSTGPASASAAGEIPER